MAREDDHAAHLKPVMMYLYGDGQCEVGLVAMSIYRRIHSPSTINKAGNSGALRALFVCTLVGGSGLTVHLSRISPRKKK